jgi:hypothetical protein
VVTLEKAAAAAIKLVHVLKKKMVDHLLAVRIAKIKNDFRFSYIPDFFGYELPLSRG